jgi:hypothetical protein
MERHLNEEAMESRETLPIAIPPSPEAECFTSPHPMKKKRVKNTRAVRRARRLAELVLKQERERATNRARMLATANAALARRRVATAPPESKGKGKVVVKKEIEKVIREPPTVDRELAVVRARRKTERMTTLLPRAEAVILQFRACVASKNRPDVVLRRTMEEVDDLRLVKGRLEQEFANFKRFFDDVMDNSDFLGDLRDTGDERVLKCVWLDSFFQGNRKAEVFRPPVPQLSSSPFVRENAPHLARRGALRRGRGRGT